MVVVGTVATFRQGIPIPLELGTDDQVQMLSVLGSTSGRISARGYGGISGSFEPRSCRLNLMYSQSAAQQCILNQASTSRMGEVMEQFYVR